MARKRRSLLGKKGSPATGIPAAPRERAPFPKPEPEPDVEPVDQAVEAAPEAVEAAPVEAAPVEAAPVEAAEPAAQPEPDAPEAAHPDPDPAPVALADQGAGLEEDDDPLIGADLTIPPLEEGEDDPAPPQEVIAHLHTRSPVEEPSSEPSAPPSDEDLVLFDERPDDVAEPAPVVVSEEPPGFDDDQPPPAVFTPSEAPEQQARFGAAETGFFGEEDGDPPTEEAPAGVLAEDFAALYSAPTDVPDAPPMPEILGGNTPAPTAGGYRPVRAASAPPAPSSPRGLWQDTPPPHSGRAPEAAPAAAPSPSGTPGPPMFRQREAPPKEELPLTKDTWFLVAIGFAAFAAIVVLVGWLLFFGPLSGSGATQNPPPTRSSPLAPDVDPPPVDLVPRDEPVDALTTPEVTGPPEDVPVIEPLTPPDEVEAPPVRRTPAVGATPPPDPVAARTGRLKIRAAKKTLVYVNGKPVGLTPLDLDRDAGKYEISADVDGKDRIERVDLAAGTIRLVEF